MGWVWCLRCNRTFRDEDYRRTRDNYRRCAYPDCEGLAPFDMIDWRDIRLLCPEYPQAPESGRAYGLPTPIP